MTRPATREGGWKEGRKEGRKGRGKAATMAKEKKPVSHCSTRHRERKGCRRTFLVKETRVSVNQYCKTMCYDTMFI
jgi:hypothetical protein